MNKYRVTFHSINGGEFTTYIWGSDLEEAMEKLTDKFSNQNKVLFYDENNPTKRAFVLDSQHIFYTEYELVEHGSLYIGVDKEFELFPFSDFALMSNEDMRTVIDNVEDDEMLAKAIKKAGNDVVAKFYDNMGRERRISVTVYDEKYRSITNEESETCQKEISDIALQLAAKDKITLK
jgi:hypothetical protein